MLLWTLSTQSLLADIWPPAPARTAASQSAEYLVRFDPHPSDISGGRTAYLPKASWFRWQPEAQQYLVMHTIDVNEFVAPGQILMADDGAVVAIGAWYGEEHGIDPVIWFYSPAGKLLRSWKLNELFSTEELTKLPRSSSTTHWIDHSTAPSLEGRGGAFVPYRTENASLVLYDALGGRFRFSLEDGSFHRRAPSSALLARRPDALAVFKVCSVLCLVHVGLLLWRERESGKHQTLVPYSTRPSRVSGLAK